MPGVFDSMREKWAQENEQSAKLKEFLLKQGLIIVQISARRYSIYRISSWGTSNITRQGNSFVRSVFNANEAEYGPATHDDCHTWLIANAERTPQELCHDSLKESL